jgi:hypothetical protein
MGNDLTTSIQSFCHVTLIFLHITYMHLSISIISCSPGSCTDAGAAVSVPLISFFLEVQYIAGALAHWTLGEDYSSNPNSVSPELR